MVPFLPIHNGFPCPNCGNQKNGETTGFNAESSLEVYPKPAVERLTVNFGSELSEGSISIFDTQGRLVKNISVTNSTSTVVNVSDLDAGSSLLRVNSAFGAADKVILVQ